MSGKTVDQNSPGASDQGLSTPQGATHRWSARLVGRGVAVSFAALAMVGAIVAGTTGLHWRANAVAPATPLPPVGVAVSTIAIQQGYEIAQRYVGRIEPARTTRIAFERAGLVTEVRVDEGDAVVQGAILARLDTEPLEVERRGLVAERARVGARHAFAKQTLQRRSGLAGTAVSRQTFDEVRFEAKALEAEIDAIDARIAALDVDIRKSTLTAPFAGTIAERLKDEGAVVNAGTEVVRLLETGRMQARIGLPPEAARALRSGAAHRLATLGRDVTATLVTLRPDLETGTRTKVALFDVADAGFAAAGELIELSLSRHVPGAGSWVPITALKEGEKGLWTLFTVVDGDDGPVIAREAVTVVHVAGERAYVRGTFEGDARILTVGTNRVTPGQRVIVSEG